MKKLLVLTVFISCMQIASGQILFRDEFKDTATGFYHEFDLATHVYFVNKGPDTSFTWIRMDVDVPDGMTTAVCDNNLCYPVEVSTADFNLGANDSFEMILHFYPDNSCGMGSFKLKVFAQNDTNNQVITEVFAHVWCLTARSIPVNQLNVYPNPASESVEINFGAFGSYNITIYNMHGQRMLRSSSLSISKELDISAFPAGMYMVAVENEGKTYTQTFLKN